MSRNKKIIIAVLALVLIASAGGYAWWTRRSTAPTVTVETIRTRDLEAIVSASGKIQPKRFVNISADTSGRVVDLAVNEGDRVDAGTVPDADRSADASHARRERPGRVAGQPGRPRAGAAGRRDGARAVGRRAAESQTAAGAVEAAAHAARNARTRGERRAARAVDPRRSARSRCARRKSGSDRIARSSRARSSISARCASSRRLPASSRAGTFRKARPPSSAR